ncbi:MAG TPA: D-glucuronyl C5-epimerase family protein [Solirubrobacteraceae bacterium]|nr:D-glucuronyl C5-epimerase family protein [Solirubrobacteraceae bacterium]
MRAKPIVALLLGSLLAAAAAPGSADAQRARASAAPPPRSELGPVRAPGPAGRAPSTAGRAPSTADRAPGPAGRASAERPPAHTAASRGPTVSGALTSLLHSSSIEPTAYSQDLAVYVAAKKAVGSLSGTRRTELQAVLANTQALAASGQLTPSRLPIAFLTLERNRQWWTTEPLLGSSARVTFPDSEIVWEHYPGQGVQIQWLGTFGEGNGYFANHENTHLRQLLSEVIPLATARAGGIAWEYMFKFDGGVPPWTSGLSQGTGIQLLARAYSRFHEPAYLTAAQQALGIFNTPPPQGVRVTAANGAALYAQYSFAPSDRILNGFIQALVGLYDYTSIIQDPLGLTLFEAGDMEARALVPRYDTGFWSMYDQHGESSLSYHELLTEFLQHLCERTRNGPPLGAAAPLTADGIYCTTAQRFTADLTSPPALSLLSTTLHTNTRAGVAVSLSKISRVTVTVKRGSRVVWTVAATVPGGRPRLLWRTPRSPGGYSVTLAATDLAGNTAGASGTITLKR